MCVKFPARTHHLPNDHHQIDAAGTWTTGESISEQHEAVGSSVHQRQQRRRKHSVCTCSSAIRDIYLHLPYIYINHFALYILNKNKCDSSVVSCSIEIHSQIPYHDWFWHIEVPKINFMYFYVFMFVVKWFWSFIITPIHSYLFNVRMCEKGTTAW